MGGPGTDRGDELQRFPRVAGCCPMGCGETLFLADGGHVTCSLDRCPNPCAADEILHERETEHVVVIDEEGFNIQHPLRERLNGDMFDCGLHAWMRALPGPPKKPGRYGVREQPEDSAVPWRFEERREST